MRRVVFAMVAALVALCGLAAPAAAAAGPASSAVVHYSYADTFHAEQAHRVAPERGPPSAYDHAIVIDDAVDRWLHGVSVRPNVPPHESSTTYAAPATPAEIRTATATAGGAAVVADGDPVWLQRSQVAAKGVSGLSDDVVGLATRNITNSGDTVLGHFPGYITKANSKGASYFDIGDAWNGLTPSQRWAANTHFLDTRIAAGDRVLLSVRKGDIRPGSYLAQEVQYLTSNGYRWTNQWSLVPRG